MAVIYCWFFSVLPKHLAALVYFLGLDRSASAGDSVGKNPLRQYIKQPDIILTVLRVQRSFSLSLSHDAFTKFEFVVFFCLDLSNHTWLTVTCD